MALVTITQTTFQPDNQYDGTVPRVRGWYDHSFIAGDGVTPVISGNGQVGFYLDEACSINGSGELVVPALTIQATNESNPTARFFLQLYTQSLSPTVPLLIPGWDIPAQFGASVTFAQLAIYNRAKRLVYPPNTYLTAADTILLINQLAGGFDYAAVGVNGITSMSVAPINPILPIAVGDNDPRVGGYINIISEGAGTAESAAQNTTAITAAVASAIAAGGGIYIPNGTFLVNSMTISVPMEFAPGASMLSVETGETVTITRGITADLSQHFGNATAGLGTISFVGNGDIVEVYPQWWGALADKTGTTGSDSGPAVQAAIVALETADGIGVLKLTGQFVCFNTTPNSTVLLVTKAMIIKGVGRSYSGLFAGTTTPLTTDVLTYKPAAASFPANDGLCIQDTTIGVAEAVPNTAFSIWACANPSARHAIVFDDSLTSGNLAIRYVNIERCNILANYANGISAGNYGIFSNGTNSANGCPSFATIVRQNLIYNGIFMANLGDSFDFSNNDVRVYNDINISQVSGASTCRIQRNVVSSRGGIVVGLAINLSIDNNIFELNEPDVIGSNGAVIDIQGPVFGGLISNNTLNNQAPATPLNLIRVNETNTSIKIDANTFFGQAGAFWLDHDSGTVFFGTSKAYPTNLASPFVSAAPTSLNFIMNSISQMPAAGTGYTGNVSQVGNGRFIGATGVPVSISTDNRDATLFGGLLFNELGVLIGTVLQVGSAHATSTRRNDIEIANLTTTGGVSIWTNSAQVAEFNAAGVMVFPATMTAGGTTGAQTINKQSGSVNFAGGAASLVVTNSLVTASSIVLCIVQTNDTTMKSALAVPGSGSFTIHANAAATGETKVAFVVFNQ